MSRCDFAFLLFIVLFAGGSAVAEDEATAAYPVAWGRPRDGLQAGLRVVRSGAGGNAAAERFAVGGVPLHCEVLVRNVTGEALTVEYPQIDGFAYSDGSVVIAAPAAADGADMVSITLAPLKTHRIGDVYIGHHRPKVNSLVDLRPFWSNSGEGLRHFGVVNVLNRPTGQHAPLDTGFIDVTLLPADRGEK